MRALGVPGVATPRRSIRGALTPTTAPAAVTRDLEPTHGSIRNTVITAAYAAPPDG